MKNIIGLMAIDADGSALNNAGSEPGALTENTIAVKKIKTRQGTYPYVSAQALRYWWRQTLEQKFGWRMSPITRQAKIAFTDANPVIYPDDDIFGYMRAEKIENPNNQNGSSDLKQRENISENEKQTKKKKTKKKNVTVTRVSPLKNSVMISVSPTTIVDDFGVMARNEGNPVPYEHQFYKSIMKELFSLNIDDVGKFLCTERTGFLNFRRENLDKYTKNSKAFWDETNLSLSIPKEEKEKRIKDLISSIPFLFGGAKSTLHLTDVTPKFLILVLFDGGNHIFSNILQDNNGNPIISFPALKDVLNDYKNEVISNVYIGIYEGFLGLTKAKIKTELNNVWVRNSNDDGEKMKFPEIIIDTPKEIIDQFLEELFPQEK